MVSPMVVSMGAIFDAFSALQGVQQYQELIDLELMKMGAFTAAEMTPHLWAHAVKMPTMIVQVLDDEWTRNPEDGQKTFDLLGAAEKELFWIEGTTKRFKDGYNWFARHPETVLAFLTLHDLGLLLVLCTAVAVNLVVFQLVPRLRQKPIFGEVFEKRPFTVNRQVTLGAVLFGIGWGLCGVCPGPAIAGLGRAGKDNACNVLITLLLDDDPEIRSASASALGDLGDPRAHTLLMHHLGVEKDERVAAAIKDAVGKLHGGG